MFSSVHHDINMALERDPAARSRLEVLLCYPGLHAVWFYRIANRLWRGNLRLAARWLSHLARWLTGIEIHPGATLGPRIFIDHGMGVVIGETAEVGADVTIYHGVTLGGSSLEPGKRHPTLGDRVVVGAGAKVLGNILIGEGSRVGANAVVVKPVPPNCVVVGVPGQIVTRSEPKPSQTLDLNQTAMPDTLGTSVIALMHRVDDLEKCLKDALTGNFHPMPKPTEPHPAPPDHGVWSGGDFSI
jgi:serine O-acetyltransferase